jgi:hypothetical protein
MRHAACMFPRPALRPAGLLALGARRCGLVGQGRRQLVSSLFTAE